MNTVSTFELLIARIAPPPPGAAGAVARRVVQGYFLTIANLENRPIRLRLRLVIASNTGNRVISSANTQVILDTGTINNSLLAFSVSPNSPVGGASLVVTDAFTLAARHTGLVAVLPNLSQLPALDLEIRGVSELIQVRPNLFQGAPTSRVLLTPEIRGTFLDDEFPAATPTPTNAELDFDQINYGLPLGSGSAENTLAAVPGILIGPNVTVGSVNLEFLQQKNPNVPEDELRTVADLFASIE